MRAFGHFGLGFNWCHTCIFLGVCGPCGGGGQKRKLLHRTWRNSSWFKERVVHTGNLRLLKEKKCKKNKAICFIKGYTSLSLKNPKYNKIVQQRFQFLWSHTTRITCIYVVDFPCPGENHAKPIPVLTGIISFITIICTSNTFILFVSLFMEKLEMDIVFMYSTFQRANCYVSTIIEFTIFNHRWISICKTFFYWIQYSRDKSTK